MPIDYKHRASPPPKKPNPAPGWVWFLGGFLLGMFVTGLAWLKLAPPGATQPQASASVKSEQPKKRLGKKAEKPREPSAPKPRFDFYTILPEMELVVPEPEPVSAPAGTSVADAPKVGGSYMLQMGSFRKYADADRLKASLALAGIEAEIQKVTINHGETFHRVRSGPYGQVQVNRLRARLKEHKISSLVIRLKK